MRRKSISSYYGWCVVTTKLPNFALMRKKKSKHISAMGKDLSQKA